MFKYYESFSNFKGIKKVESIFGIFYKKPPERKH